jgi:hypothetical protein
MKQRYNSNSMRRWLRSSSVRRRSAPISTRNWAAALMLATFARLLLARYVVCCCCCCCSSSVYVYFEKYILIYYSFVATLVIIKLTIIIFCVDKTKTGWAVEWLQIQKDSFGKREVFAMDGSGLASRLEQSRADAVRGFVECLRSGVARPLVDVVELMQRMEALVVASRRQ